MIVPLVVRQETKNSCGASVIAMVAGLSWEDGVKFVGTRGCTDYKDLIYALDVLGIDHGSVTRLRHGAPIPAPSIVKLKWNARRSHWVVWDGEYCWDPAAGQLRPSDYGNQWNPVSFLPVVFPRPEPILTKHIAQPDRDYKPMGWERFLQLRAWARWIAWREQCTVALVGSALEKAVPRDIDIAIIWPAVKFEEMFGTVWYCQTGHKRLFESRTYEDKRISLYHSAQELVNHDTRIDVRLCPDCWWPEKDRLILATPSDTEPPNSYNGTEFIVRKVVRAGEGEG